MMVRILLPALLLHLTATPCRGEMPAGTLAETPSVAELCHSLRDIIVAHLPDEYEDTRDWGGTKEVWDGLRVSLDGFKIKTKRRKKLANHGTWKRYRAWLIDPDRSLRITLSNFDEADDGHVALDAVVRAHLGAFGRMSEWRRDVQLYSIGVDAEAHVTLRLRCKIRLAFDFTHLPPDIVVDPTVTSAQLSLDNFRLIRVSDLSGPLVRQVGKSLQDVLQREIDKRQTKLQGKLNRQLAKESDQLRFSLYGLLHWDEVERLIEESGIEMSATEPDREAAD